jgi:hypothetical protein
MLDETRKQMEIDKMAEEIKLLKADPDKRYQDIRLAPWGLIFTAMGAGAALMVAATGIVTGIAVALFKFHS